MDDLIKLIRWITVELNFEKGLKLILVALVLIEGYAFYSLYTNTSDCQTKLNEITEKYASYQANESREKELILRDGINKIEHCINEKETMYREMLRQKEEVIDQYNKLNQLKKSLK